MSGQELFQIVSTGKTLRSRPAEEVVEAAAHLFKIPVPQAQRLMLKGWVIKDRLTRASVVNYQTRLHQLGLKIAVCPAGKYDNRALVARIQAASQRRNRRKAGNAEEPAAPATKANAAERRPATSGGDKVASNVSNNEGERRALEGLGALFATDHRPRQPASDWLALLPGVIGAAIVPAAFALGAAALLITAIGALWEIPASLIAGEFSPSVVIGVLASLLLSAFAAAFTVVPFFLADPDLDETLPGERRSLQRAEAPQLFLLLQALSERAGLPMPGEIRVSRGGDVTAGANLKQCWRQQPALSVGLSAVRAYSGGELLGLLSRALGLYAGRGWALVTWLVLGTARRLQFLQAAFEDGRVFPAAEQGSLLQRIDRILGYGARPLAPVVDRLLALHQRLGQQAARRLQRRADRWCAAMIGSEAFSGFADKWQQVVHSALIASEANREAAIIDQRLEDFPAAVVWLREQLDDETRDNLELAMTHASDPWDAAAPADINRIADVEAAHAEPMLRGSFSPEKLLPAMLQLCRDVSALGEVGASPVGHLQLLAASREAEESMQVLQEYFNRIVPLRVLSLALPQGDESAVMDLQECIDWLRGKLVELREYQERLAELEERGALMQLGRILVRAQLPIEAGNYRLCGTTLSAADESISDNRARRRDLEQQIRVIHSVFALRIERARELMAEGESAAVGQRFGVLHELESLAPRMASLDLLAKSLGLALERLDGKRDMRAVNERLADLARGEWQALRAEIGKGRHLQGGDLLSRLDQRVGEVSQEALPGDRPGQEAVLRQLQSQLKTASALILEYYRIQLAAVLSPCLALERSNKMRPLRLIAVSA
ncbi:hypothetical protein [Microbulbifer guangxiensis]|uniref:hypothetical protein n=1 Tax=Microbulbifer guangxiensis TaxID=2904249 RepID=UPI001F34383D|nr:hypothetical protein [Microbulbifer guangxiensis]